MSLDLAKQLAADHYREEESAKARLNDLLMKISQIYEGGFVGGYIITDRLPASCRRRRPPTLSNGDGQLTL
jgi:hypothetical protein